MNKQDCSCHGNFWYDSIICEHCEQPEQEMNYMGIKIKTDKTLGKNEIRVKFDPEQVQTWEKAVKDIAEGWGSEKMKDFIAKVEAESYEEGIKRGIEALQRNIEELGKLKPNRYKEKLTEK